MSRSYKKNPWVTDHTRKFTKEKKRLANHSFRRKIASDENMPARPKHRKYSESWDICDYKWRMTRKEAIEWYYRVGYTLARKQNVYSSLEKWMNYWEKCHRRK